MNAFQGHSKAVNTAVFSQKDNVISGSDDHTVKVGVVIGWYCIEHLGWSGYVRDGRDLSPWILRKLCLALYVIV